MVGKEYMHLYLVFFRWMILLQGVFMLHYAAGVWGYLMYCSLDNLQWWEIVDHICMYSVVIHCSLLFGGFLSQCSWTHPVFSFGSMCFPNHSNPKRLFILPCRWCSHHSAQNMEILKFLAEQSVIWRVEKAQSSYGLNKINWLKSVSREEEQDYMTESNMTICFSANHPTSISM